MNWKRFLKQQQRRDAEKADMSEPIFYRDMPVNIKAVDLESRSVPVVASTEAIDSHDEIVEQDWDLGRFKTNPAYLWNHNRFAEGVNALPLGTAENVRVENRGTPQAALKATLVHASAAANPMAEHVLQSFNEGSLRMVSVGFRPRKIRFEERDGRELAILGDNLLLEISATPIGSNPEALAEQKSLEQEYLARKRAVVAYAGTPVVTGKWDSKKAEGRIRSWAGGEDISWAKYRRAFAWYDSANPEVFGSYKLPHHDVVDGSLVTHRSGVIAAGNAMQGGRGGVDIPDSDRSGVRSHLARHYKQFDMQPPWERSELECSECKGTGEQLGPDPYNAPCEDCNGAGVVHVGTATISNDSWLQYSFGAEMTGECDSCQETVATGFGFDGQFLCDDCYEKRFPSPKRGDETPKPTEVDMDTKELQAALDAVKAENAVLKSKLEGSEASAKNAKGETAEANEKLQKFEGQNKRLEEERDAAIERAEKAERQVIELEVDSLVGTKITPAERDDFVELKLSNPELFKKFVDQRKDLGLIGRKVPPERVDQAPKEKSTEAEPGKGSADAINAVAFGGQA
jgi:hypothetical protein